MMVQKVVRGLGLMALAASFGCGAAQEPPSEYGYGDMFESQSESSPTSTESYNYADEAAPAEEESSGWGGGGEAVAAEPMAEMDSADMMPSPAPARHALFSGRRSRAQRSESPPPPPAPVTQAAPSQPEGAPSGGADVSRAPTPPEPGPQPADRDRGREPSAEGEQPERLMIYEATLGLATREVRQRVDEAVRITYEMGGFLQSQDDTSLVVRVPAARFREALDRFETLGDVVERRVSAQDVSEQVRDIQIRLRNAIQLRDRLTQLLARAQTVAESLTIEHELERLNEMIELMQGQLEALEDRIAFSTISVRFQAVQDQQEIPRESFRLPFVWLDELGLQFLMQL